MNDEENEMSNYCVSAKNGPTKKRLNDLLKIWHKSANILDD